MALIAAQLDLSNSQSLLYHTHARTHARTHTGEGGGGERSVLRLSVEVVGDFCLPALAYDVFQVIDSDGGFCTFDATGANC